MQEDSRARGLTAKGAATKARIVDSAADLILQRGVAGTTVDDVLAASGTGRSQLYHYFADKDALVEAVIGRQTDRVLSAQSPYLQQLDSLGGLRRWCDAVIETQRARGGVGGCPIGSLASELADSSEPARMLLAASLRRWESYIARGLRQMTRRGELGQDCDPEDLAAGVMAALQGGLLLTQVTRSTRHLEVGLSTALARIADCQVGGDRQP